MITNISYYEDQTLKHGDIAYLDEICNLDIYTKDGQTNCPVLVWIHGGGLTSGSKEGPPIFNNSKIMLVSVGYRLYAQGAHCPDYIWDTAAAIAWVIHHIAEYGGDPSRIYVCGHSAGAYLLTMVALNPKYLEAFGCHPRQVATYFPLSGQMSTHFTILEERKSHDPKTPIFFVDEYAPLSYPLPDKNMKIHAIVGDRETEFPARVEENMLFVSRMHHIHGCKNVTLDCVQGDHNQMLPYAIDIVKKAIEADTK